LRIVHGDKELTEKLGRNVIYARAVQVADFKKCCLPKGIYDGALRDHYF